MHSAYSRIVRPSRKVNRMLNGPMLESKMFFTLFSLQNLRVKYYKEGDWISEMKLAKGWK